MLHWNKTVLTKDSLRKCVFVDLSTKTNPVHVKQKQRERLPKVKKSSGERRTQLLSKDTAETEESAEWWGEGVCKCSDLCWHPYQCAHVQVWVCGVDHALSHAQSVCGLPDTHGELGEKIPLHTGWWNCERKHWAEIINPWFSLSFFKFKLSLQSLTCFQVHTFTLFWEQQKLSNKEFSYTCCNTLIRGVLSGY